MFAQRDPGAGRILACGADVGLEAVEEGDVFYLVVEPVVVGVGLVEQGVVNPEEVHVLVESVEDAPVDSLLIAQHVVVGFEGDGNLAVPVDDVIVLAAVGAARLIADDGKVGIRVQAVVGKADAFGRNIVGQISPLRLVKCVRGVLHQQVFLELPILRKGGDVPVADRFGGRKPEAAGQPGALQGGVIIPVGPGPVRVGSVQLPEGAQADGNPFDARIVAVTLPEGLNERMVRRQIVAVPVAGNVPGGAGSAQVVADVEGGVGVIDAYPGGHFQVVGAAAAIVSGKADARRLALRGDVVEPGLEWPPFVGAAAVVEFAPTPGAQAANVAVALRVNQAGVVAGDVNARACSWRRWISGRGAVGNILRRAGGSRRDDSGVRRSHIEQTGQQQQAREDGCDRQMANQSLWTQRGR